MPHPINKARTEAQPPTQGQFVQILQSGQDPYLPSVDNMSGTKWDTDYAAQGGAGELYPTADDRALLTGNDANQPSKSGNLITDTFISWTIVGNIVDSGTDGLVWQGTTGNQGNPSEASATQGLSAGWVTGDFIELTFDFEHYKKSLLVISLTDDDGELILPGVVGGLPGDAAGGSNSIYLSGVADRDTVGQVKLILRDDVGDMEALAHTIVITKTPSVTP